MNSILSNDIEFSSYVDHFLEDDSISEEERNQLITAKIENEMQSVIKIEGMRWAIKKYEKDLELIDEEIEFQKSRKKAAENKIKFITDTIFYYMKSKGLKEIDTGLRVIKIVGCKKSVNIINEAKVPAEFIKIIPEHVEYDRNKMYPVLNNGDTDWGELVGGETLKY
ncbi:MAG: siphovirus Gp157 family protein [Erysipelotrichaceae bacterium]